MAKTGGGEAEQVRECCHPLGGTEKGARSRGEEIAESQSVEPSEAFEVQTNAWAGEVINIGGEAVHESDRALVRVGAVEAIAAAPERAAASKRTSAMVGSEFAD